MVDDSDMKALCGFRGVKLSESHARKRDRQRKKEKERELHRVIFSLCRTSRAAKGFRVTIQHSSFAHFIFIALAFRLEAAP